MIDERTRLALAELESQRDDAVVYLSSARSLLEVLARGHGVRACGHEVAQVLVRELGVEACAVTLRDGDQGALWLGGLATQSDRLGGPGTSVTEAGWLALARLVGPQREPTCFRRDSDGGFTAMPIAELAGEGFLVLPFRVSDEMGGALVLHTLVAPAQVFGRAPALGLLADIVGQVITVARARDASGRLCDRLSQELGATRRVLSAHEQSLRAREESIGALTQELLRSNRVKTEFLGTVSHELRTPLNAILGYASLLREGVVGSLSDEQSRLLDRALGSTRNLSLLIDDILFFVQVESDSVLVRPDLLTIREVVEDVLCALCERPDPADVALEIVIAPSAAVARVDAALLRRVLFHLLSNAFKFTSTGTVSVEVQPGPDTSDAVVVVRDTGVGIPPERQRDVFEAFAQVDGSDTRRYGGLGMGLALVQRAVRLLRGQLSLRSALGVGSEFRVTLPGALDAVVPSDELVDQRALH
ncbi:MAG TPA: ATP-binding protein [Candidatus Binatia bacterium]|nr:ATP-binding protein [Candidatus Binatia bacterium]